MLDTLSRLLGGGVDSDPKDVVPFLNNVERSRKLTGIAVMPVHHIGKDRERGIRGASQITDYCTTTIEISKTGAGDRFDIGITTQIKDPVSLTF